MDKDIFADTISLFNSVVEEAAGGADYRYLIDEVNTFLHAMEWNKESYQVFTTRKAEDGTHIEVVPYISLTEDEY